MISSTAGSRDAAVKRLKSAAPVAIPTHDADGNEIQWPSLPEPEDGYPSVPNGKFKRGANVELIKGGD